MQSWPQAFSVRPERLFAERAGEQGILGCAAGCAGTATTGLNSSAVRHAGDVCSWAGARGFFIMRFVCPAFDATAVFSQGAFHDN